MPVMKRLKVLKTPPDVIDTLGGTAPLSRELGLSYRRVFNWRGYTVIPPCYYPYMTTRLRRMGYTAPPELWGVYAPKGFRLDGQQ
jgi:hypothetical protein